MNAQKNLTTLFFTLLLTSAVFGQSIQLPFFNQNVIDYTSPYYAAINCPDGQQDIVVKTKNIMLHPKMVAKLHPNRPFFVRVYLDFVEREYCFPNGGSCGDFNMQIMVRKSVKSNVLLVDPEIQGFTPYGDLEGGLVASRTIRVSHSSLKNSVSAFLTNVALNGTINVYDYDLKASVKISIEKADGTYFIFNEETIIPVIYC